MLTLTENAQTAIKTLTSEAGLPEDGGVRIAMADGGSELQMALSPEPAAGDQVIDTDGARVFVAEETAPMLDAQELDATETEQGTGFSLRKQV
ncbi:HesB/IscA family protein [Ruania albidiflava]|uniref:HesB/IscA family protein n=1 Tax=Ruania albidiflava TaxID=366586 RepID=UPI0003B4C72F|nr:iron-sulfur cluster assembly accessory protein [Ruania albidiflava]